MADIILAGAGGIFLLTLAAFIVVLMIIAIRSGGDPRI